MPPPRGQGHNYINQWFKMMTGHGSSVYMHGTMLKYRCIKMTCTMFIKLGMLKKLAT